MQQMPLPLSVRGFTKWSEADSDDEDKLHIVEEDSIIDSSEEKTTVFNLSSAKKRDELHDCSPGPDALIQEIMVKEECVADEEEEKGQINETLCQEKTGVITSDFPGMEQSVPKGEVHEEYGTSDEFPRLYSCPYCSRGYKRHTALKEHIKQRHEKNKDDLCCSLCSYTFTYRTQLDRHMKAHKNGKEQTIVSHLGVNRKFKCTECSKAFKYKHHLKEHLRIHSGEKPYECSNCKKRFSHSGSYSSHISSKKCIAIPPADNCLSQDAEAKIVVKIDNKHLQLHHKIKEEPNEHEPIKTSTPVVTTNTSTTNNEGGISIQSAAPQAVIHTFVLPTLSLVQPISINLQDLQNMLKLSVDRNVILQAVGSSNVNEVNSKVVHPGQPQTQALAMQSSHPHLQVISAISLPVLDQDGNSKIIINCSVDSQLSTSDQNTTPSILTYQTVPAQKVVDTNRAPAEQGNCKSSHCLKLAEANTTQINVTSTPKLHTSISVPTQMGIIKSTQPAALNKAASIIKVTKLSGQTKLSQPTMFFLRTVNRPQGQMVKQLAVANSQVTVGNTDLKTNPENIMAAEQNSLNELDQVAEVTSTSKDKHQSEDLRISLLQGVNLKSETMSEIKEDCEESLQIQKEREMKEVTPQSESTMAHRSVVCGDGFHNYATCLFCDNSPSSTDALNVFNSIKKGSHRSFSSLLGEEESFQLPPLRNLLPLLKAYTKDSHPSEEQLSQVAELVSLPRDVVSRWFQKMQLKKILLNYSENPQNEQQPAVNFQPKPRLCTQPSFGTQTQIPNPLKELLGHKTNPSALNYPANDMIKKEDMEEKGQVEPLDLSLPKSYLNDTTSVTVAGLNSSVPIQEEPLNLTSVRKETLNGNTILVTHSTNPISIIATPLPTVFAIEEPGGIPCLKTAISTKKHTILIPQLSYTYTSPLPDEEAHTTTFSRIKSSMITTSTATDIQENKDSFEKMKDAGDECKGSNDGSLSPIKKKRKMYGGQYACDLCDKCFQKSSSLLRHKYEHTGKRPHECGICKKAFKHKHHLIEHSRLHSGEKPYRCDKCGKRFSHSGSYSQHMNHRYSYCKKVHDQPEPNNTSSTPPLQLDSDERESEDEEDIDDNKEPEGEKDGEEDFFEFDMSDIRVVMIGQEYDEKEEKLGRGEEENVAEEDIVNLEKDVKTLSMEEQTMKHKTESHSETNE